MTQGTATRIVVRRTVSAPAAEVFAVLADPARHPEIDGSQLVRAAVDSRPLSAVGDVFTMEMTRAGRDYLTENQVTVFKADRRIAWTTALPGDDPSGFFWAWELQAEDALTTEVVHTHDWSAVTDPAVLARVTFPRISAAQMQQTLDRLATAVS